MRFAVFVSILLGVAMWTHRRTFKSARSAHSIQFEDLPPELLSLSLESAPSVYNDLATNREQEIEEEIEWHLRMAIRDRVERGEPAEYARRAVLREFGNVSLMKDRTRQVWRWTTVEQIIHDLRSGTRILRRAPLFGPWESAQVHVFMQILIAVGLLTLLIVCANVANLMLGRSVARQREMAVRRSMGGSRLRILRMLFSEALALSLLALGAAFLFTVWVSHAVVKLIPPIESGARLRPDLSPDWSVAAYATALAVCSALTFMLTPGLRVCRQELLPWFESGRPRRRAGPLAAGQCSHGCAIGVMCSFTHWRWAGEPFRSPDRDYGSRLQEGPPSDCAGQHIRCGRDRTAESGSS